MKQYWQASTALEYRNWQDEWVIYSDLSGDTVLLESDAAAVFQQLLNGPCDIAALVAALNGQPDDGAARRDVLDMLERLQDAGIVSQVEQ